MMGRVVEVALWLLAASAAASAAFAWHRGVPAETDLPGPDMVAATPPDTVDPAAISRAAREIAASDPFSLLPPSADRADGAPADTTAAAFARRPPGASLRLTGIVGGPPWEAIIEGVPGADGAVVARAGDRFGDLRVRSVDADRVIVQGVDSTWTLTLDNDRP